MVRRCYGLALALALCMVGGCDVGSAPERDGAAAAGDAPLAAVDLLGPRDGPAAAQEGGAAKLDVGGAEADARLGCGPADSECSASDYMKSCSGGKCFGAGCCCPASQQCRAGSFPVCCPPGQVCKNTATGECG